MPADQPADQWPQMQPHAGYPRRRAASAVLAATTRLSPPPVTAVPAELLSSAFGTLICAVFVLSPNVSASRPPDILPMHLLPRCPALSSPARCANHTMYAFSVCADVSNSLAHRAGHGIHHSCLPADPGAGAPDFLPPPPDQGCVSGEPC